MSYGFSESVSRAEQGYVSMTLIDFLTILRIVAVTADRHV
jgi:hypothetical protein